MATELSPLGQESSEKRVQFSFPQHAPERDLGESARLLAHQAFSPFSQHTNNTSSEFQAEEASTAPEPMVAPQPNIMFHKPADLQQAPDDVDSWPKQKMRIACTHCGHYIETRTSDETGGYACTWGDRVSALRRWAARAHGMPCFVTTRHQGTWPASAL